MKHDKIFAYCDASFSKDANIAIIGCAIFRSEHEHKTLSITDIKLNILQIQECNNIRAEIRGAIMAMQSCPKGSHVIMYSDCQTVCNLPARRNKLESSAYISKSKRLPLNNADLYKEFYSNYDYLSLELNWIKGHNSNQMIPNAIQKNFSHLDIEVRKTLRSVLSNTSQVAQFTKT